MASRGTVYIFHNYKRQNNTFFGVVLLELLLLVVGVSAKFFFIINEASPQLQKKKTENENFPNVNLILSICQLTVYLTIPIE
jgi:hypothetical protein